MSQPYVVQSHVTVLSGICPPPFSVQLSLGKIRQAVPNSKLGRWFRGLKGKVGYTIQLGTGLYPKQITIRQKTSTQQGTFVVRAAFESTELKCVPYEIVSPAQASISVFLTPDLTHSV